MREWHVSVFKQSTLLDGEYVKPVALLHLLSVLSSPVEIVRPPFLPNKMRIQLWCGVPERCGLPFRTAFKCAADLY